MPDLLVAAALSEPMVSAAVSRPLGSRGSREEVADLPTNLPLSAASVLAGLPGWWRSRAAAVGLSGKWLDIEQALQAKPPISLPTAVRAPLDLTAFTPEGVGAVYVESLPSATRARHGQHYTPLELADRLWGMARAGLKLPPRDRVLQGLVLDPACGAGALLLPALREHLRAAYEADPSVTLAGLPNLVRGTDMDAYAVWVANVILAAEMLPTFARVPEAIRRPLPAIAIVADGLDMPQQAARVVVMNPPYGRVRLAPAERERYAHVLYGHANLYGLFMAGAAFSLPSSPPASPVDATSPICDPTWAAKPR
jgi:adenine-specific DNA-methyltransferase